MQIAHIEGMTRNVGKSQGYPGLPLRDGSIGCPINGPETPTMTTAWFPTPDELDALNAGAAVHVTILGGTHPPIGLGVGPVPDAESV